MAEAYHYMAQILYKQRKYSDAEDLITNANQASAGYDDWIARNLLLLSDVYFDQGDKNSASAAIEVVLENYKGNDDKILAAARQKQARIEGRAPAPVQNSTNQKGIRNMLELDEGN
jgi:TolA-binding protein